MYAAARNLKIRANIERPKFDCSLGRLRVRLIARTSIRSLVICCAHSDPIMSEQRTST